MKRSFLLLAVFSSIGLAHLSHEKVSEGKISNVSSQHLVNRVTVRFQDGYRLIDSNGIPDHVTGEFPNRGNPHSVQAQVYHFKMTEVPSRALKVTPIFPHSFGVVLNGVPLDPGTAEFWNRDPHSGWIYEALYRVGLLGMDNSPGHVQPDGAYHYHGLPDLFLQKRGGDGTRMTLIGYAADGFPIYGPSAPSEPRQLTSPLRVMKSSYRVKSGVRPSGPSGSYTGEYTADFEYVPGLGDLDECNGREGVTPEYPQGTYYYVLTKEFPHISRFWRGTPDQSFFKKRRPGGPRGPGGPGGPERRPPPPF